MDNYPRVGCCWTLPCQILVSRLLTCSTLQPIGVGGNTLDCRGELPIARTRPHRCTVSIEFRVRSPPMAFPEPTNEPQRSENDCRLGGPRQPGRKSKSAPIRSLGSGATISSFTRTIAFAFRFALRRNSSGSIVSATTAGGVLWLDEHGKE